MPMFGPYEVGAKIPDTALVGVDTEHDHLFVAIGHFSTDCNVVPAFADRQQINAFGVIQDYEYCGPDRPTRVVIWGLVPRN
jgi:hypothetical protein